jgi:predicted DNA binding protein
MGTAPTISDNDRMKLENRHGEKNGMARLTARQVRAIRRAAARGATQAELGAKYGVSSVAIHYVVNRVTWRHVP